MEVDDYNCVLCNEGHEETSFHLLSECAFGKSRWNSIPIDWNLNLQPLDMVIEARSAFGSPLFREIFITGCWTIWMTRNGVIFDNGQININIWKRQFKNELGLVCLKAKSARQNTLNSWRENYL